ncbi:hypothetical protein NDU88_004115 [Pleurodeles waltl]|uniref:Uncharacterized protein n=1 Tax=Pleurodeles waltl TaxID=8319 RepID=A0AAV7L7P9_PLEWA|nr:hypothetical protein NDU88_004115 [Pleurodeles waltl]
MPGLLGALPARCGTPPETPATPGSGWHLAALLSGAWVCRICPREALQLPVSAEALSVLSAGAARRV